MSFVELFDQITRIIKQKVVEEVCNDKLSPKIDQSAVTENHCFTSVKVPYQAMIYKGWTLSFCPYKFTTQCCFGILFSPPSDSMLKGLYFESKCLGISADGGETVDLPRHKKTGAKLADHDRIDQAVERFFQVKQDYGLVIDKNKTQVYHNASGLILQAIGIFRLSWWHFGLPFTNHNTWLFICICNHWPELTKDKDVCDSFSNGLFHATPWGNMEAADFTEAIMYRLILWEAFCFTLVFVTRGN